MGNYDKGFIKADLKELRNQIGRVAENIKNSGAKRDDHPEIDEIVNDIKGYVAKIEEYLK